MSESIKPKYADRIAIDLIPYSELKRIKLMPLDCVPEISNMLEYASDPAKQNRNMFITFYITVDDCDSPLVLTLYQNVHASLRLEISNPDSMDRPKQFIGWIEMYSYVLSYFDCTD